MLDMVLYLFIMFIGYAAGGRLRSHKGRLGWTSRLQTVIIVALVFVMGMRMGSNEEIVGNLKTIGVTALAITVLTHGFSIAFTVLARKAVGIDRYGLPVEKGKAPAGSEGAAAGSVSVPIESADGPKTSKGVNTMTIFILLGVIAGMVSGFTLVGEVFAGNVAAFDEAAGVAIKVGLCVLLGFVGLDLGLDGTVFGQFKKVGFRVLIFPVATILGTVAASLAAIPLLDLNANESLAIGAGLGWYTLAPGIIMEAGYVSASAISFLHNVLRELIAILITPAVASKIGYIETTCLPGASAMDVCLPIIERATRSEIAIYSFVSGVVLSFAVPALVPLFIGM